MQPTNARAFGAGIYVSRHPIVSNFFYDVIGSDGVVICCSDPHQVCSLAHGSCVIITNLFIVGEVEKLQIKFINSNNAEPINKLEYTK